MGTSAFTHKALVALRKYLETRPGVVEHRVIHDMYFLCLAEAYRYNEAGYMAHLRAVKYLVDLVGGLATLDQHMKETLILGDVYLGAERLSAPVFPLDWDPGKLAPKKWEQVVVDTTLMQLGRGILCMLDGSVVTSELREIVKDMVQCVQVAQYTWTHPKSLVEIGHWLFLRNLGVFEVRPGEGILACGGPAHNTGPMGYALHDRAWSTKVCQSHRTSSQEGVGQVPTKRRAMVV
jgi:hypothetical protein